MASPAVTLAEAQVLAEVEAEVHAAKARAAPAAAAAAADKRYGGTASEQPFHEAGAAQLAAVPEAASVSDASVRAAERARSVNFRDLSTVAPARIQPGRVFRSSQVVSAAELDRLRVAAVLDLRQPALPCKTDAANLAQRVRSGTLSCLRWLGGLLLGRGSGGGGSAGGAGAQEEPAAPCFRCSAECCEHYGVAARVYHVDLLPRSVSVRILFELPAGIQARVLWALALRRHPEPIVAGAVADPEVLGYLRLYQLLLEHAGGRLAGAVRLAADPANLPCLVHCIHGKDRTGLVSMLLLLLCGVDRQAVIRDYAASEALLRESREKAELLGIESHLTTDQVISAAARVMADTIDRLEGRWGSAHNYLRSIGLSDAELQAVVHNLTAPGLAMPSAAAAGACKAAGGAD